MPSPVQRASFGGGSVLPSEPPQGRQRRSRSRHFFFVANAFKRTLSAIVFFRKVIREKTHRNPAYCLGKRPQQHAGWFKT